MLLKNKKIIAILSVMTGTVTSAVVHTVGAHQVAFPVINQIWNLFINAALMTGVLILITSIVQFIQAVKDEDAEVKAKVIKSIVVGVCLVSFRVLIDPILNAIGFFR